MTHIVLTPDEAPPPAERVDLAPGAWISVRPADTPVYYQVQERVQTLVAAALLGARGIEDLAAAVGQQAELAWTPEKISAEAQTLALAEMLALCAEDWAGFGDDERAWTKEDISPARMMLVVRHNPEWAKKLGAALNVKVYQRALEGNGSAASPSTGEAAAENGASRAGGSDGDVRSAAATQTGTRARKRSTRRSRRKAAQ